MVGCCWFLLCKLDLPTVLKKAFDFGSVEVWGVVEGAEENIVKMLGR